VACESVNDGSGPGIAARRYDVDGNPLGDEFQVNTTTTNAQRFPSVAARESGEFVVVWQGVGPDGAPTGIFAQRYDAAGAPTGSEFQVNVSTVGNAEHPAVSTDPGGGFVVAWQRDTTTADLWDIFARRYMADGTVAGSEFRLNAGVASSQTWPAVEVMDAGGFVAAWQSSLPTAPFSRVMFRMFDASDAPITGDVTLQATSAAGHPKVAVVPDGGFVIVWDGVEYHERGFAQSFDAAGVPVAPAQPVTSHPGRRPAVAMQPGGAGQFVVVWTGSDYTEQAGHYNVRTNGRNFDREGTPLAPPFVAGPVTQTYMGDAAVAGNASGQFVVAWVEKEREPSRALVRRFDALEPPDLIFADGFDSGDLSAWTGLSTDNGDVRASMAAAMAATPYGLETVVDDTQALHVRDATPVNEPRYRARFHFDPNGFDPGESMGKFRAIVFLALDESPVKRVVQLILRLGGLYSLQARVALDDGTRADDGSFQLWIDGVSTPALTGLDNDEHAVDLARLGAMSVKAGAAGSLYFDGFDSRRATYIGP
jgi:hypothetical protein